MVEPGWKGTGKEKWIITIEVIIRYMGTFKITYVNFRVNDVDETSENDNEVEYVPGVAEVILRGRNSLGRDQGEIRALS